MTAPPRFDEQREPRNYIGWALSLIFILLTSGFAASYYSSVGSEKYRLAQSVDRALRDAVLSRPALKEVNWRFFDKELERLKAVDPARYALLRAVASYERTKSVDPNDLAVLRASKNPVHRTVADVYTKQFGPRELDQVDAKISRDLFAGALAAVHLHERAGDAGYRKEYLPRPEGAGDSIWIQLAAIGSATMIGLMLLAAYIALRAAGFLKPLGHPLQNIGLFDADRLAMRSAQIMAAMAAIGLLSAALGFVGQDWAKAAESAVTVVAVLALFATPIWGRRFGLREIGVGGRNLLKNVGWGLAGFFANIPILIFVAVVSQGLFSSMPNVNHPIVNEIRNASGIAVWLAVFMAASVQAPIVEEVLFRGSLLPAMSRVFQSPLYGIVLSSLIFASGHSTGLPSWLPLASIGAMAAALTYQTRSLVPAIVMHAVHNTSMLLVTLFGFGS